MMELNKPERLTTNQRHWAGHTEDVDNLPTTGIAPMSTFKNVDTGEEYYFNAVKWIKISTPTPPGPTPTPTSDNYVLIATQEITDYTQDPDQNALDNQEFAQKLLDNWPMDVDIFQNWVADMYTVIDPESSGTHLPFLYPGAIKIKVESPTFGDYNFSGDSLYDVISYNIEPDLDTGGFQLQIYFNCVYTGLTFDILASIVIDSETGDSYITIFLKNDIQPSEDITVSFYMKDIHEGGEENENN